MDKLTFAFISFLICLLSSCSGGTGVSASQIDGYDMMESCPDVIKNLKVIPLEETESSLLTGPIKKVVRVDSKFLVQDSFMSLYCFDENGKFLNRISREGRANNEYISLSTFCVDKENNILLFDSFTDKVLRYTIDGSFIDAVKMKKGTLTYTCDCFFLDEDRLFQTCFLMGEQNEIYSYLHFADGIRNNIYTCPMSTSGAMEMVGKHAVSQNSNGCHLIIPFDNNVYKLEGNELKSIISISTEGKLPSENVLRDQKDFSIMTSVNLSDQGYFQGFTGLYETDKYMLLTYYNLDGFLIEKGTDKGVRFELEECDNGSVPFLGLIADGPDYLIGVSSYEKIDDYEQIKKRCGQIEKTSNPYLLVYEFD